MEKTAELAMIQKMNIDTLHKEGKTQRVITERCGCLQSDLGCHVICWCWSTVFSESTVNAAIYQEILEHFMLPSADKLYGDADLIFQQDLAPAHTAKGTKSWFNDHGVTVLDWPANSPDLNPHRESMRYCQEEDERHQTQQCR